MVASHYKRPLRIRPVLLLQPSTPLDAKSIAAEALAVIRECSRLLIEHHAQEASSIRQLSAMVDTLEVRAIRALTERQQP